MATYDDVIKAYTAAGFNNSNFSDSDSNIAMQSPDAGLALIQAKLDWQNASTPEARALANQQAEAIRAQYGYSGGGNGMGNTTLTGTAAGLSFPSVPKAGTDTSAPSYIDFMQAYNNSGYNADNFSSYDMDIARQNPQAGINLINGKQAWQNATTPEEKTAANAYNEAIRAQYGYSGGDTGMGYTELPQPAAVQQSSGIDVSGLNGLKLPKSTAWSSTVGGYAQPNASTTGTGTADGTAQQTGTVDNNALLALLLGASLGSGTAGMQTSNDLFPYYKYQYNREGNRATQDTIGKAAALTGGIPSSYAVSAAQQMQNYYNQQLIDKIPELYEQGLINIPNANSLGLSDFANMYNGYMSEFGNNGENDLLKALYGMYAGQGNTSANGAGTKGSTLASDNSNIYLQILNALTGQNSGVSGNSTAGITQPDGTIQTSGDRGAEFYLLDENGNRIGTDPYQQNVNNARNSYETASANIENGTAMDVQDIKSDPTINAILTQQLGYVEPYMWNSLLEKYSPESLVAAGIQIYYGDTASKSSPIPYNNQGSSKTTEPTFYPDGTYPKKAGYSQETMRQQSERQFLDELIASGITMSNQDLQLAMSNPEAGRQLLYDMQKWQNAVNDREREQAHTDAEKIRMKYGGYSGGTDGFGTPAVEENGAAALPAPTTSSSSGTKSSGSSSSTKSSGTSTKSTANSTTSANTASKSATTNTAQSAQPVKTVSAEQTAQQSLQQEIQRAMSDPQVQQYLANGGTVALPIFNSLASKYSVQALIGAGLRV